MRHMAIVWCRLVAREERWDKLSVDERRAWSAEIAKREALAQGLPAVASPERHREVAAILTGTSAIPAASSAA